VGHAENPDGLAGSAFVRRLEGDDHDV